MPCEKLTKITTLRLAMKYITTLSGLLRGVEEPERWPSPVGSSDVSEFSTEPEQSPSEFSTEQSPSELAEDSLSPFETFFAEFDYEYSMDRTFS